jgi:hypothetical protein
MADGQLRGNLRGAPLNALRLIVSGFHKGMNLVSFSLAEVFVGQGQLRPAVQEALNAKHPQPPNHQLLKLHFALESASY